MKKLLLSTTLFLFTFFGYSQSDILLSGGKQITMALYDNLNYQGKNFSNYAMGWMNDSSDPGANSLWLSGFGGVRLFTQGAPRLSINGNGNVGIGTENPQAKLDVGDLSENSLKSVLARLPEGNNENEGTYLGVKSYKTVVNDKSFSLEHKFYGQLNSSINFYRGGAILGGSIGIAVNNGSEIARFHESGLDVAGTIKGQAINGSSLNVTGAINSQSVRTNRLEVEGIIHAREINVDLDKFPDYVFAEDYKLPTLNEVKAHIDEHKHLPGIPSEKEVLENGVNMGEMQVKLLEKVEELTLYVIQQQDQIAKQQEEINVLRTKLEN